MRTYTVTPAATGGYQVVAVETKGVPQVCGTFATEAEAKAWVAEQEREEDHSRRGFRTWKLD